MDTPRTPRKPIDPLLQQRAQHTGGRRAGSPLPPPSQGPTAQGPTAQGPTAQRPAAQPGTDAAARIAALAAARGTGKASSPAKTRRRAKPARSAKLASLALSAVTTIGLAGLFASQNGDTDSIQLTDGTSGNPLVTVAPATTAATDTTATADTTADTTAATTAATTAEEPTTVATAAPTTEAATATGVLDGTYVGATDTNRWGNLQVQVVYSGGVLTDVQILQYPDGDRKSVAINQRALPTLISEAISLQSADVSSISGATYTYNSYRISLQSAIDAAMAASGISG